MTKNVSSCSHIILYHAFLYKYRFFMLNENPFCQETHEAIFMVCITCTIASTLKLP